MRLNNPFSHKIRLIIAGSDHGSKYRIEIVVSERQDKIQIFGAPISLWQCWINLKNNCIYAVLNLVSITIKITQY